MTPSSGKIVSVTVTPRQRQSLHSDILQVVTNCIFLKLPPPAGEGWGGKKRRLFPFAIYKDAAQRNIRTFYEPVMIDKIMASG